MCYPYIYVETQGVQFEGTPILLRLSLNNVYMKQKASITFFLGKKANITAKHTIFRFVMGDSMKQMHADTFSSLLMVLIFVTAKESTIEI
jgi:hypothetical protein